MNTATGRGVIGTDISGSQEPTGAKFSGPKLEEQKMKKYKVKELRRILATAILLFTLGIIGNVILLCTQNVHADVGGWTAGDVREALFLLRKISEK